MSIKTAIIAHLNAASGLTALVSDRISLSKSAQSDTLPRITVQQISGQHQHHMTAAAGVVIGRFQVNCYASSGVGAANVAEQVRLAMDGFRGLMAGDTFVSMCHLEDESDLDDPPEDGSDQTIFTVRQDYLIGWGVSVPAF